MLADIIPTHQAAQWLLTHIDRLLDHLGLDRAKGVEEWVYVAVIVAVALLAGSSGAAYCLWPSDS